MARYIVKRILWLIPILLGVSILIFTLMYLVPGDPVDIILGANATDEAREALRESMGLNQSYIVQLGQFLKNTFLHLDLGNSYLSQRPVLSEIMVRLPYTLKIVWVGLAVALVIGVPLGIMAATHQNTIGDYLPTGISVIGVSMPCFWFAMVMISVFSMKLKWFPVQGVDSWKSYVIPVISSAIGNLAVFTRLARSNMLEQIRQDYITTARAKGQKEGKIIYGHALRNALLPIITQLGNAMAGQIGFAIVLENLFSIPGIGQYLYTSIMNRDYPAVRGSVLVMAVIFTLMSLAVDLVYTVVDPRMKSAFVSKKKRKKSVQPKEVEQSV